MLDQFNMCCGSDSRRKRAHNRFASKVTCDAGHACMRMCGFQAERELTIGRSVKRNAEFDQIANARRAIFSNQFTYGWIDQSCTGGNRIGRVLLGAVLRMKGCC